MINAYAAFEPKGELKPYQYDPGVLADNEVEIDVLYSGICHSDLSVIDNEWGMSQYPVVPGHEVVGRVSQVGSQVNHLQVGQTVGLGWHSGYCGSCALCNEGDHNLCSKTQKTIIGHHGGFADKVRAQGTSVVALPDGIDLESAGPLFCAGVTVFNPLLEYDIKPTSKVAVIGIGGLGHLALKFLNAWGCEVTAFTTSESKRQEALSLGAHHTLNSKSPDELDAAAGSFDLIISTVNVKLDWARYLMTLKARGRLHFVGMIVEPLDIGVGPLIVGQRSVSGSAVGSPSTMSKMLEFAKLHDITPVIEKFKFSEVNEAIERLKSGKTHYRIVLER